MDPSNDVRMMLVDPESRCIGESVASELPSLLRPGDLVVVNDAATVPASLRGHTADGAPIEARLLEAPLTTHTRALLFGAGDHRIRTEDRERPPTTTVGDVLFFGSLALRVVDVDRDSARLVTLAWPDDADERFAALYREARPIQYSYVEAPLALWDVQTSFAARPWAVEMPSAGRPLHVETLVALRRRGIEVVALTHAAGISSSGEDAIDRRLPFPERFAIPERTAEAVNRTIGAGGRVIAIGTSVVRALEDSALKHGRVVAEERLATLVLEPTTPLRVVTGLFTGIHVPGESHYRLMGAFVDEETLARAAALALAGGFEQHELGDACLVLDGVTAFRRRGRAWRCHDFATTRTLSLLACV